MIQKIPTNLILNFRKVLILVLGFAISFYPIFIEQNDWLNYSDRFCLKTKLQEFKGSIFEAVQFHIATGYERKLELTLTNNILPDSIELGDMEIALEGILELYPDREVQGVITLCGQIIITAIGSAFRVEGPRPIRFMNRYYIAWHNSIPLEREYYQVIEDGARDYVFIPIVAMFHTHVYSGSLSDQDLSNAAELDQIRHLLIDNRGFSEFNGLGIIETYSESSGELFRDIYEKDVVIPVLTIEER